MKGHGANRHVLKRLRDGIPRVAVVHRAPEATCRRTGIHGRQKRIVTLVNRIDSATQIQGAVLCPRSLDLPLRVLGFTKTGLTLRRIGILRIPSRIRVAPFPFLPKVGRQLSLRRHALLGHVVRRENALRREKESTQKHQSCQPNPT